MIESQMIDKRGVEVRISIVAFALILLASFTIVASPTEAASGFDGTYDLTTTSSYGSYTEPDFLIISNGKISDADADKIYTQPPNWPPGVIPDGSRGEGIFWYTFIGNVDSNGNANWRGGCLVAAGNFDYTYTGIINADGTGSGTFSGNERGSWSVHKSSSSGLGLSVAGGMAPAVSALVIVISIVAIAVASTPVKIPPPQGFQPQVMSAPSPLYPYQPSIQTETPSAPIGPPDPATSWGGAGLSYGTPLPTDRPLPPRDHFMKTSQQPPRCPYHHDIALVPHTFRTDGSDPGSWFCPKCSGYPWGRN